MNLLEVTQDMINDIYLKELNNQTSYISKRTSTAEQIDNVINNTLFGVGAGIYSSLS